MEDLAWKLTTDLEGTHRISCDGQIMDVAIDLWRGYDEINKQVDYFIPLSF